MIGKISVIGIAFVLITCEIKAQAPLQTVTFKVRKINESETIILASSNIMATIKEEGVWFVDENATFQGGDLNTFSSWIARDIQYPAEASEKGITGKVIIQFSVDLNGKIRNAKVIRSVHPLLDNEAIRVIYTSPRWQPAKLSGKPVMQNFVIPIVFSLQ